MFVMRQGCIPVYECNRTAKICKKCSYKMINNSHRSTHVGSLQQSKIILPRHFCTRRTVPAAAIVLVLASDLLPAS
jgi:hypothetical protein